MYLRFDFSTENCLEVLIMNSVSMLVMRLTIGSAMAVYELSDFCGVSTNGDLRQLSQVHTQSYSQLLWVTAIYC